jgi:integrase
MARKPRPWYRSDRNQWFVTVNGTRHLLGDHPADAARPQQSKKTSQWNPPKVISDKFHALMADEPETVSADTIWGICDLFLDHIQKNRAEATYGWYKDRLQYFKDAIPNMLTDRLEPDRVQDWLDTKDWAPGYTRGIITAIKAAFRWAARLRKIRRNPLDGLTKPEATLPEEFLTDEEFKTLLSFVKDEPFRDILRLMRHTGARPQELVKLEARHVFDGYCQLLKSESKGKKKERIIFLDDEAQKIVNKWLANNPEGVILRNYHGKPWKANAFACRFKRLEEKVGKRITMYSIRHGFAHSSLTKAELSPEVVATLMGHKDTRMIYATYGHMIKNTKFMREQLTKATATVPGRATSDAEASPSSPSARKKKRA